MYHVSCSGDAPCPQSYNTTNNHTRSHTFTGFTSNSNYTFSVVAINSIGSGEAGIVMVEEIINATIAPSVVTMTTTITTTTTTTTTTTATTTTTTTIIYITSREDISMTTSSEWVDTIGMSSEIMMSSISTVNMVSANMSSVSIVPTMTPTEDMTTTTSVFSSSAGMTAILYYTAYCMIISYSHQV